MARTKKIYPLLFAAGMFAAMVCYIELRLPLKVDAQGRDGVYDSLAVTETGASAVRIAGGIHAGGNQVVKADGTIPRAVLSMANGSYTSASAAGNVLLSINRFSFLPTVNSNRTDSFTLRNCYLSAEGTSNPWMTSGEGPDTLPRIRLGWSLPIVTPPLTCTLAWDYLTNSDNPSVWILMASDGSVSGIWESEDPAGSDPPMSIPQDDDGNDVPGFTVSDIGLPALPVIESLYANLPLDQRTAALTCTGDYVRSRGWLAAFSALTDLSGIVPRYEPSGRQWAQRCAAQAAGVSTTGFYLQNLVVVNGAWALP